MKDFLTLRDNIDALYIGREKIIFGQHIRVTVQSYNEGTIRSRKEGQNRNYSLWTNQNQTYSKAWQRKEVDE